MTTLGVPLVVRAVSTDERVQAHEAPDAYLKRIVAAKLAAARSVTTGKEAAVLVADTVVLLDGLILGKPIDDTDAMRMVSALAGRTHEVWTRFATMATDGSAAVHRETVRTQVTFRPLDEREVRGYVATGEGRDKAGAYAIQGIGSFAVSEIRGSYSNVVGLPACEVVRALTELGLLSDFPGSLAAASWLESGD